MKTIAYWWDLPIEELEERADENGKIKQLEFDFTEKKRKRKDDSKKGDVFLNCRSCGDAIAPDFYSAVDKRYCKDCY